MSGTTPIPVHLVLGGLGSGKTTVIRRLLESAPRDETWAVLLNSNNQAEGMDNFLARNSPYPERLIVKVSHGGCFCCSGAPDLAGGLNELVQQQRPDRILATPAAMISSSNRLAWPIRLPCWTRSGPESPNGVSDWPRQLVLSIFAEQATKGSGKCPSCATCWIAAIILSAARRTGRIHPQYSALGTAWRPGLMELSHFPWTTGSWLLVAGCSPESSDFQALSGRIASASMKRRPSATPRSSSTFAPVARRSPPTTPGSPPARCSSVSVW